ncbi:DUF4440 domain-containing protein [Fulvivirga ulvae]|uniref:YybH family protein n=1 Tax=Fulvivirga ulvae TaxID=2904245 RepID=UPI001F2FEBD1|nr:nuclear transport factor 2 family protein [Fulvivirga ulvae]UII30674.1 DUF4440 domain-containing protein [Fulvivirga ulvae]
MHKTSISMLVLVYGIVFGSQAQQPHQSATSVKYKHMEANFNQEQKKVFSTIEKMVTAFQNQDIESVLSTYEPDAIVMFEPQTPVSGRDMLRKAFTEFAAIKPRYTFNGHEIYIAGNIATHLAPWTMVGYLPDGNKIEQSGLSIAVLRKQTDGTWLMIQDNPHGQFLINY